MTQDTVDVQKLVNNLPEAIRGAIYSLDILSAVIRVGRKYDLHIDQVGALEDIVNLALVGAIRPEEFTQKIILSLGFPRSKATFITKDISEAIFRPINKLARETSERIEPEKTEIVPATPSLINYEQERVDTLSAITNPQPTVSRNILAVPSQGQALEIAKAWPLVEESEGGEVASTLPDIHEEKLLAPVVNTQTKTKIEKKEKISLIPQEMREKINKDPYKESI